MQKVDTYNTRIIHIYMYWTMIYNIVHAVVDVHYQMNRFAIKTRGN
jgi:hypothetical protein